MSEEELKTDYMKLIKFTSSLEELHFDDLKNEYNCYLKNHPGAADYFYGASHGRLILRILPTKQDKSIFYVFFSIQSIDDGSLVFFGPNEDKSHAIKRIDLIISEINNWGGWIPNERQCKELEIKAGVYWNR
jgi:hypothetical protein